MHVFVVVARRLRRFGGGRLWKARFPYLPKPFGNFHEKVDRMNNVFHLTQVRFVYAFVTTPKFKMVAQISPWIAYNWWLFVNGTCASTGNFQREKRATFPKLHLFPGTFQWNALKTCVSLNIPTRISGISWLMESAQDNDFLFLNFDTFLSKNSPKFVELNEIEQTRLSLKQRELTF